LNAETDEAKIARRQTLAESIERKDILETGKLYWVVDVTSREFSMCVYGCFVANSELRS